MSSLTKRVEELQTEVQDQKSNKERNTFFRMTKLCKDCKKKNKTLCNHCWNVKMIHTMQENTGIRKTERVCGRGKDNRPEN